MGCINCGAPTSRRKCRECARVDRLEERRLARDHDEPLADGGPTDVDEPDSAADDTDEVDEGDDVETECAKYLCDAPADVTYTAEGQTRVRCEQHALEDVEGVGGKKAEWLMEEFGSIANLCDALVNESHRVQWVRGFSRAIVDDLETNLRETGLWEEPDAPENTTEAGR